ncbi:multiprotein-bridging factor 1 family protein [Paenibacillus aestuarii]|uniref:Multiprotein-bridging factor 1 family protein n=1 Tax=Paenibacillus aestuarii TaxID=516965 RepID=A0ABW0K993_9BACL
MELLPHEKLKIYRQRKGYTQHDLALLLRCSQMQVSRLERGRVPSDEDKELIEKTLGTSIWTTEGQR